MSPQRPCAPSPTPWGFNLHWYFLRNLAEFTSLENGSSLNHFLRNWVGNARASQILSCPRRGAGPRDRPHRRSGL
eukprot:13094716-Alexandrium_andersonii.AAC.1